MTTFYTYLHCKPDGIPFYCGKGFGDRAFKFNSGRNKHHNNIVEKYGKVNIGVFVFPCESETQAFADEIQHIAQLRREGYELCNYSDGGEGPTGAIRSIETRKKLSESHQGQISHMLGKSHTKETKDKISKRLIGKKLSKETCAK